jgi:Tfp pilus assembly protein PilN
MRFDYLRDARPEFIERLQASGIPKHLQVPLMSLTTAVLVVTMWWIVETLHVGAAEAECAKERTLAIGSREQVIAARAQISQAQALISIDQRVRSIRISGARVASRLADVANHVPDKSWLTAMSRSGGEVDLNGYTVGLEGLGETLLALTSSEATREPILVRASRNPGAGAEGSRVINFQMQAKDDGR